MLPLLFLLMGQPVDKLDKGLLQLFLTVPAHSVHDEVVPVPAFSGRCRLVRQLHPLRGSKSTRSGHTGNLEQLPCFHITSFDPGNSFVGLGYGGYDPALLLLLPGLCLYQTPSKFLYRCICFFCQLYSRKRSKPLSGQPTTLCDFHLSFPKVF